MKMAGGLGCLFGIYTLVRNSYMVRKIHSTMPMHLKYDLQDEQFTEYERHEHYMRTLMKRPTFEILTGSALAAGTLFL